MCQQSTRGPFAIAMGELCVSSRGRIAILRGYRLRPVEAVQAWLSAAEIGTGRCSDRC